MARYNTAVGNALRKVSNVTPAATDITVAPAFTDVNWLNTDGNTCGLTAKIIVSNCAISGNSIKPVTPNSSTNSSRCLGRRTTIDTSSLRNIPCESAPRKRAPPMAPTPIHTVFPNIVSPLFLYRIIYFAS